MMTLIKFGVFSSMLFVTHAAENEQRQPYKYAPTVNLSQVLEHERWTDVIKPREWPFDTFVVFGNGPNKNPMDMVPVTFWIVYKGNDSFRPQISQMSIQPGANIHTLMESFCDEAGFVDGPDSLACRGVELKDHVSELVYGLCYTTTRSNTTMDDYVASRTTVITWLIYKYSYRRYLEIGCDWVITFATIQRNTMGVLTEAVCVDPNKRSPATHHLPSDTYFETVLGLSTHPFISSSSSSSSSHDNMFDIVFVDGLHDAHQAYRDTLNALRVLAPGGTVLIHDVNPPHEFTAMYPKQPGYDFNWHGDVWKTVVALRMMPNIEVVTLDVDFGIAIVRVRPNTHPLSDLWFDYLGASPLSVLRWDHLNAYREELLRLVSVKELYQWLMEKNEQQQGQGLEQGQQQGQGLEQGLGQGLEQGQGQEHEQRKSESYPPPHRRDHKGGMEGKDIVFGGKMSEAVVDFRAAAKMFPF